MSKLPTKVKFTITKVEQIEVEISSENGFDMPETIQQVIDMDNEIKNNPKVYITNINGWVLDDMDVGKIEYICEH